MRRVASTAGARGAEHPRQALANEQALGEIPAVDDREPEPARRHGVRFGRPILVERHLDAGDAFDSAESIDWLGIDRVAHPVVAKEDDTVPRAPVRVPIPPATAAVELDHALDPSRTV